MKRLALFTTAVLAMFWLVQTATADSPHFKKGGEPSCTLSVSGGTATVSCTGTLSGLGNADLVINTTLTGFATYTCTNGGGNAAPGQNRVNVGPQTTPTTIKAGAIKNGSVTYTATGTLTAASTVSGAAAHGSASVPGRGRSPYIA